MEFRHLRQEVPSAGTIGRHPAASGPIDELLVAILAGLWQAGGQRVHSRRTIQPLQDTAKHLLQRVT